MPEIIGKIPGQTGQDRLVHTVLQGGDAVDIHNQHPEIGNLGVAQFVFDEILGDLMIKNRQGDKDTQGKTPFDQFQDKSHHHKRHKLKNLNIPLMKKLA